MIKEGKSGICRGFSPNMICPEGEGKSFSSQLVQIIRYKNRKLYSRTLSTYVTLGDIRDIIKQGKSVQVSDYEGSDITATTLAQVLTVTGNVPVYALQSLIRSDSDYSGVGKTAAILQEIVNSQMKQS